jgi:hypothetical protein
MLETKIPIKTFRGTLAEVLSRRDEIPPNSIIDVIVYQSPGSEKEPTLAESLAELVVESEIVQPGEPIKYTDPTKRAFADYVVQKFQKQSSHT